MNDYPMIQKPGETAPRPQTRIQESQMLTGTFA